MNDADPNFSHCSPARWRLGGTCLLASVLGLASLASLAGCDGSPGEDDDPLVWHGKCDDVGALPTCNIYTPICQIQVFSVTACARDHTGRELPPVSVMTESEFADYLTSSSDDRTAEEKQQAKRLDQGYTNAFQLLGLIPPSVDSGDDAEISSLVENVLAFYSSATKAVTVIDHSDPDDDDADRDFDGEVFTLSHEFVHAQQDVDYDLSELRKEIGGTFDQSGAYKCFVEGEAVAYSNFAALGEDDLDDFEFADFDDFFTGNAERLWDGAIDPSVYFTEPHQIMPYIIGARYVVENWYENGNKGVAKMAENPTKYTLPFLLELDEELPKQKSLDKVLPDMPDDYSELFGERLGAWIAYSFIGRLNGSRDKAWDIARNLSNDLFLVSADKDGEEVLIAWWLRFHDNGDSAEALAELIEDERPAFGKWEVELDGNRLRLLAASDGSSALKEWAKLVDESEEEDYARGVQVRSPVSHLPRAPKPRSVLDEHHHRWFGKAP